MASSKDFLDYVLEQLRGLHHVSYRPMMGEFLLYYNGVLFGGVYDNRLLIKKTNTNKNYIIEDDLPYNGAKPMLLVENLDDENYLIELVKDTYRGLK